MKGDFVLIFFLFVYPQNLQSASWTPDLSNGDRKYACNGHDLTLPWKFILSQHETLEDIQWFYHGNSEELVAIFVHGSFFTPPPFSGRVQFVDNAGLTVSHVTISESGNYSVVVTLLSSSGDYSKLSSTVNVDIRDRLLTNDGSVHIQQNPLAVRDPNTDAMVVELWCGEFNYNGQPPFQVDWLDPSGRILPSTTFIHNHFTLTLTEPIAGGNYTCRIPARFYGDACLQGDNSAHLAEDSLIVDQNLARIKILEAEKVALEQVVQQLMGGSTPSSLGFNSNGGVHVSFFAEMTPFISTDSGQRSMHEGDVFVFGNLHLNQGSAYNNYTGIFVAPVAGTYYFSALISSWALEAGISSGGAHSVGFCFHADGVAPDGRQQCIWSPLDVAVSSFKRLLQPGNRVWVESHVASGFIAHYNAKMASFTGFLVDVE